MPLCALVTLRALSTSKRYLLTKARVVIRQKDVEKEGGRREGGGRKGGEGERGSEERRGGERRERQNSKSLVLSSCGHSRFIKTCKAQPPFLSSSLVTASSFTPLNLEKASY